MYIIKILGAALIVFAGFLCGRYMSENLALRCRTLENIIKIALFLKEQIVCFRYEIEVIYKNLIDSGFDEDFVLNLKNTNSQKEYLKDFDFLTQKDKGLSYELFSGVGMRDAKGEEENILVYIKLINEQLEFAKQEYAKKDKLYKNVGTFLGIGLAIFLI